MTLLPDFVNPFGESVMGHLARFHHLRDQLLIGTLPNRNDSGNAIKSYSEVRTDMQSVGKSAIT